MFTYTGVYQIYLHFSGIYTHHRNQGHNLGHSSITTMDFLFFLTHFHPLLAKQLQNPSLCENPAQPSLSIDIDADNQINLKPNSCNLQRPRVGLFQIILNEKWNHGCHCRTDIPPEVFPVLEQVDKRDIPKRKGSLLCLQ